MCRSVPDMKERTVTEWMRPKDVADVFGVTPRTVTAWADAGSIPVYVMPSGHRRYKRTDVERFLTEAGAGA